MSVGTIDSYSSGYSATFLTPGVRPTDQSGQFRQVQPVPPVNSQNQQGEDNGSQTDSTNTTNTNPTAQQRSAALASGNTRGSFVNITA